MSSRHIETIINSNISVSSLINTEELLDGGFGDDDINDRANAWTAPIQRSWETIQEDATTGTLKSLQLSEQRIRKSKIPKSTGLVVEKGVIRYLYIIIDLSLAIQSNDLKPSRKAVTLDLLELFVAEYFAQNPISQLGFIISHNKIAEKITELSGNPQDQINKLRSRCEQLNTGGEMSLQNSIELARNSLSQIPPYGSREILILMANLSSCDATDIYQTINTCTQQYITISIIHMSAELYICTQLSSKTNGSHSVVLNANHYKEVLFNHIPPLPVHIDRQRVRTRKWIRMGFPEQKFDTYPSICNCHNKLKYGGYTCPQCRSRYCELPTECKICLLTLVSSPHLARSYHHLFPAAHYNEINNNNDNTNTDTNSNSNSNSNSSNAKTTEENVNCSGCLRLIVAKEDIQVQCESCNNIYCIDCDEYVHNSLHNCPGCTSMPKNLTNSTIIKVKTEPNEQKSMDTTSDNVTKIGTPNSKDEKQD